MKKLIINPETGIAGDMFIAALISTGLPVEKITKILEESAAPLGGAQINILKITRMAQKGTLLKISLINPPHSTKANFIMKSLIHTLEAMKIIHEYRDFAVRALNNLIDAETEAHNIMDGTHHHKEHCHLHEAQDILIDIAGAAWCLKELKIDMGHIQCLTPVVTGHGKINFSHGEQNIPAPATEAILRQHNVTWEKGTLETELLTPTGAAILTALNPRFTSREEFIKTFNPDKWTIGRGMGTKDFSHSLGKSNSLNIYIQ